MQRHKLSGSDLKLVLTAVMAAIMLGGHPYRISRMILEKPFLFLGVTALLGGLSLLVVWRDRQRSMKTLKSAAAKASRPQPLV